ncbi:MAG: DnaD domain protein [Ruminococcaceae bacterium]|nr:DnaD domain protein [Oscillospiraceae bacterium]
MGFKINSAMWNSIFAVPACLVDEHLTRLSGQQLKVFIYVLRHNDEDVDEKKISSGTGMSVADVKDAMSYWISEGIILRDGDSFQVKNEKQTEQKKQKEKSIQTEKTKTATTVIDAPVIQPTYEQIAARLLEDTTLKALFNEVQIKLGRTIGYSDQAKIIMLHDDYCLPPEVILTILEYCIKNGKPSLAYAFAVGKDWANEGINNLDLVDEKIKELRADERMWKKFEAMFTVDPPRYTDFRFSFLKKWRNVNKQSFELIHYAYELTIEKINKPEFRYMNTILESWKANDYKTPEDVIKDKENGKNNSQANGKNNNVRNFGNGNNKKGNGNNKNISYDSEKVRLSAQAPIEYKRRQRNGK